jgi:hypothetical protein
MADYYCYIAAWNMYTAPLVTSRWNEYIKQQIGGCIQKFPDWDDNEINNNNNKHSLRSNTKGYGGKTH